MISALIHDKYHAKDRVAFGAALLDEYSPGWFWHIDLGQLATSSARDCVGAQIIRHIEGHHSEGSEWSRFTESFLKWCAGGEVILEATGFDAPFGEYGALTRAWKDTIGDRREKDRSHSFCAFITTKFGK